MIYLNTAGTGKLSRKSVELAKKYLDEMVEQGSVAAVRWRSELDLPVRTLVAKTMDAAVSQVALVPNTSYGLNTIADRLVGERKRVLTIEGDYPSITLPWQLKGFDTVSVEFEDLKIETNAVIQAIEKNKSEIIVLSHVMWHTGFKVDIDTICAYCKENGIISIIDVTQSLGTIPLSFRASKADIMLSSCYKWLHAGFGLGILAMSESFFNAFPPQMGGFGSFQNIDGNWAYAASMKSYQPGSLSISATAVLKNALEEIHAIGIEQIHTESKKHAEHLVRILQRFPVSLLGKPEGHSLSNLICIASIDGLFAHLEKHDVVVVERDNQIRFSVSHTTGTDELNQLDGLLSAFFTV